MVLFPDLGKLRSPKKSSCAQTLCRKTSLGIVPHFLPNFIVSNVLFNIFANSGTWKLYVQSIDGRQNQRTRVRQDTIKNGMNGNSICGAVEQARHVSGVEQNLSAPRLVQADKGMTVAFRLESGLVISRSEQPSRVTVAMLLTPILRAALYLGPD